MHISDKVGLNVQGSNNGVRPKALNNAMDTEVSNTLCEMSNDNAFCDNHCKTGMKCEVTPIHDKSDSNSVWSYDINNTWDTDKFVHTVVPKLVQDYLEGNQAFDFNGRNKVNLIFALFHLLTYC